MSSIIIDRRTNVSKRSSESKDKYLTRVLDSARKTIHDVIMNRKIGNATNKGVHKTTKVPSTKQPTFTKDYAKSFDKIGVGNDKYKSGDHREEEVARGAGDGAGDMETSATEDMIDLSKEELEAILFEGLELPNFVKKAQEEKKITKKIRAGYTRTGIPTNLDLKASFKQSFGRRIAHKTLIEKEIADINASNPDLDPESDSKLFNAQERLKRIPYLTDIDLRYKNKVERKEHIKRAVIYCMLDVSGSMANLQRRCAKLFYILLYNFLTKAYTDIELVFVVHTTDAHIVSEKSFFNMSWTGGTLFSEAYELINNHINEHVDLDKENVYLAQVSDGDNFDGDNETCLNTLINKILPKLQYFLYLQTNSVHTIYKTEGFYNTLFNIKTGIDKIGLAPVSELKDVYVAFRELFETTTSKTK